MHPYDDPTPEEQAAAATDEGLLSLIEDDLAYVAAGYRYDPGENPSTSDIDCREVDMDAQFAAYRAEVARRSLPIDVDARYREACSQAMEVILGPAPAP